MHTSNAQPACRKISRSLTRGPIYSFRSRHLAMSARGRFTKPMWLVLGDHDGERGEYWLVCPADAARLERAGYALA